MIKLPHAFVMTHIKYRAVLTVLSTACGHQFRYPCLKNKIENRNFILLTGMCILAGVSNEGHLAEPVYRKWSKSVVNENAFAENDIKFFCDTGIASRTHTSKKKRKKCHNLGMLLCFKSTPSLIANYDKALELFQAIRAAEPPLKKELSSTLHALSRGCFSSRLDDTFMRSRICFRP